MIEKLSREQMASISASWLTLINPQLRQENMWHVFDAGRRWACDRGFDVAMAVVEAFTWSLACSTDASAGRFLDLETGRNHYQAVMRSEVGDGDVEFNSIMNAATDIERRTAWVQGVADAFVLMGGNFVMEEWQPERAAMH